MNRALIGLWESPGPGTAGAGNRHGAAAFLHHHVNVCPHDLGDLANLKTENEVIGL